MTKGFLSAAVVFVTVALSIGVEACPLLLPFSNVTVNGVKLPVEIASTPAAQMCGLSHRKTFPEDRGMLFIYPESRSLEFWMKDTEFPLSIAFLDYTGRILSIQDMDPMQTEARYRSPAPAKYAIEVSKGWFARHRVKVGDMVEFNQSDKYGAR